MKKTPTASEKQTVCLLIIDISLRHLLFAVAVAAEHLKRRFASRLKSTQSKMCVRPREERKITIYISNNTWLACSRDLCKCEQVYANLRNVYCVCVCARSKMLISSRLKAAAAAAVVKWRLEQAKECAH